MAKSQRVILFVSSVPEHATEAQAAFSAAASRLGLTWSVRSGSSDNLAASTLNNSGVSVLVGVELPGLVVPGWEGRIELLAGSDRELEVNRLLARLLGGNDQAVPPPPPPPPPKKIHTVKVGRETAGRRGKGVTVVTDLPLNEEQLKELATRLKNTCGTGGTAKDGRIEIQGDQRDRLVSELEKLGYKVKRSGG